MTGKINAVRRFIEYAHNATFDGLSDRTIDALKVFTLDSVGVGISGSRLPDAPAFKKLVSQWGKGSEATVWSTGETCAASGAAMLNAWQIHNQEFDCIHEKAVVHPMAVILPCLLAYAETQKNIDGKRFLSALSVAVDIATILGEASNSPVRFFRPAICGAMGATIGMAKLADLDIPQMTNAFGLIYSQISGTMQAHTEGSPMLAMQIAMNARSAMNAVDMAKAGFQAPHDVLEGPFGFFTLIEPEHELEKTMNMLGTVHQIERVSHKPFPTGRACHGGLDALAQLLEKHRFSYEEINTAILSAPPLIEHLTGRRPTLDMSAAYARLCFAYSAATFLMDADVGVTCYDAHIMRDPKRIALADRFVVQADDCGDANAMTPQTLTVQLKDGRIYQHTVELILGSPGNPLTQEQYLHKFKTCCAQAAAPLDSNNVQKLISTAHHLERLDDVSLLAKLAGTGQNTANGA